jgi:hypothetical protein
LLQLIAVSTAHARLLRMLGWTNHRSSRLTRVYRHPCCHFARLLNTWVGCSLSTVNKLVCIYKCFGCSWRGWSSFTGVLYSDRLYRSSIVVLVRFGTCVSRCLFETLLCTIPLNKLLRGVASNTWSFDSALRFLDWYVCHRVFNRRINLLFVQLTYLLVRRVLLYHHLLLQLGYLTVGSWSLVFIISLVNVLVLWMLTEASLVGYWMAVRKVKMVFWLLLVLK